MSTKKVRLELEEKLGLDLLPRKKEIDALVLACINADEEEDDEEEEEADDGGGSDYSAEEEVKPKKRASTGGRKPIAKKKKKYDSEDDDSEADDDSGSDYKPTGPAKGGKGKKKAKKGSDDSDSDEDYKAVKKSKKKAGGKGNGYTRPLKLSPELAELMGQESLPRHEVVKKMWEIIKGRNLLDPTNRQFAICDDEVYKVIGVKRFRPFGMLKYLKDHFVPE